MKVGIIIGGTGKTGAPRRLLSLASEFRKLGIESSIITYTGHPIIEAAKENEVTVDFLWRPVSLRKGVLSLGLLRKIFIPSFLFATWVAQFIFFREKKYDVVVVRSTLSGIHYLPLYLIKNTKVVLDIDFEPKRNRLVDIARVISIRRSSAIVAQYKQVLNSEFSESQKCIVGGKFYHIIPGISFSHLGRDSLELRWSAKKTKRNFSKLIQVGTICERKNQLFSLSLLKKMRSISPSHRFQIQFVGSVDSYEYMTKLENYIEENKLNDCVEFFGWSDDVIELMRRSDFLIMPSVNEGIPNAIQEAMYIGLPVMASDVGGIPEIVVNNHTGWVTPLSAETAWIAILKKIINDSESSCNFSISAANYAEENFSVSAWAKSYANVIEKLA